MGQVKEIVNNLLEESLITVLDKHIDELEGKVENLENHILTIEYLLRERIEDIGHLNNLIQELRNDDTRLHTLLCELTDVLANRNI